MRFRTTARQLLSTIAVAMLIAFSLLIASPLAAQEVAPADEICVDAAGVITECVGEGDFPTAAAVERQLQGLNQRLAASIAEQEAVLEVIEDAAYAQRLILGPAPRVGITLGGAFDGFNARLEPSMVSIFADLPFAFTDKRAYMSVGGHIDILSTTNRERSIVPHAAVNYRVTSRLTAGAGVGPDINAAEGASRMQVVGSGSFLVQPGWGMIARVHRSKPADDDPDGAVWFTQGGIFLSW